MGPGGVGGARCLSRLPPPSPGDLANTLPPRGSRRGLFKSDRLLGTAQLRLPVLETVCELREILEVSPAAAPPPRQPLLVNCR